MAKRMILAVAAIIVNEEGRILIDQRPVGARFEGKWEFPGGKVEHGEDPRAALRRECQEELGCDVKVGNVYETIFFEDTNGTILLIFYCCRILKGEARPMENNPLAWVTIDEMRDYELLEADRVLPSMFDKRFPNFEECLIP